MKRNYFYLLLALCIGAVVMSCRPTNEPEKPDRPHLGDTEINIDSPVGTVGTLDGHEAMVVDLGGSIGKVAIATMNVGATSVTDGAGSETTAPCYGDYLSYDDAVNMIKYQAWGKGWYVPSHDEIEALVSHLKKRDGYSYYQWAVTKTSFLCFPLAGYINHKDDIPHGVGCTGFYASCTDADSDETIWGIDFNMSYAEMRPNYKDAKLSVRLFHKLPSSLPNITKDSPVGTIGLLDGREGIVVDLGGDIGTVVIATMNVGATSVIDGAGSEDTTTPCYGDYLSFEDAKSMSKDLAWGKGWYLPSKEELEALKSHLKKRDGYSYYQWAVTKTSILYFPLPGLFTNNGYWQGIGCTANYVSCTEGDNDTRAWGLNFNQSYAQMMQEFRGTKSSVRPFHKMPKEDLQELNRWSNPGIKGTFNGVECMVLDRWPQEGKCFLVATMNVGATDETAGAGSNDRQSPCYGNYMTWNEAMDAANSGAWGYGWKLPDFHSAQLLVNHTYRWYVGDQCVGGRLWDTDADDIYLPCPGYMQWDYQEVGGVGRYWTCEKWDDNHARYYEVNPNGYTPASLGNLNQDVGDRLSVRPMALLNGLNKYDPVGTVGQLGGHTAMVVYLGAKLGKVAVAIMNNGARYPSEDAGHPASNGNCYGNYFNYDDACSADLGDGWYMPNEEQMTALLKQFQVWDIGGDFGQVGLQYPVGDQTLYMPYCGKIVNDADQLCGKEGFYWIKQANNSESKYIWLHDGGFSVESGDRSDRMTVRPIHDLSEI